MGEDNGGRWGLEWKFIDCPSSGLKLLTEGGNKWYAPVLYFRLQASALLIAFSSVKVVR